MSCTISASVSRSRATRPQSVASIPCAHLPNRDSTCNAAFPVLSPMPWRPVAIRRVRSRIFSECRRHLRNVGEPERTLDVVGHPELIRVTLQNLVQNALRYSPSREPVEIRLTANQREATVETRDRGEGVAEDQLEHVFSRFYRVDPRFSGRSSKLGRQGTPGSVLTAPCRILSCREAAVVQCGHGTRRSWGGLSRGPFSVSGLHLMHYDGLCLTVAS